MMTWNSLDVLKRANSGLDDIIAERDALRALVGDLRVEVDTARRFARDAGKERDALHGALTEMRAYINKHVTLTDSERWLLTTIEAALPD